MKFEIDNVYISHYGQNNTYQSYFIEFDLVDNYIKNVDTWNKIFDRISDGRKLKIILEWNEEKEINNEQEN